MFWELVRHVRATLLGFTWHSVVLDLIHLLTYGRCSRDRSKRSTLWTTATVYINRKGRYRTDIATNHLPNHKGMFILTKAKTSNTDLLDMHQTVRQVRSKAEGTLLAEVLHNRSSQEVQGTAEPIHLVGILFPSSDVLAGWEEIWTFILKLFHWFYKLTSINLTAMYWIQFKLYGHMYRKQSITQLNKILNLWNLPTTLDIRKYVWHNRLLMGLKKW